MTHRLTSAATTFALLALLVFLSVVAPAARADALTANGHGPGYFSSDGWWLGTYTLDDGSQGFCLNAGRESPVGFGADVVEGETLGWFTPEKSAQLAYISRSWAGTSDRTTAAAGQLATWMIAGLNGKTPESYAARAGADAAKVLARAKSMITETQRQASRAVRATTTVELADAAAGRARVELVVDRLTGTEMIAPRTHSATVELVGAVFDDGTTSATVSNGVDLSITPTGTEQTVSVTAAAAFGELPYGDRLRVAVPRGDAQSLLIAVPATAKASAEAEVTGVSPLPFQPVVRTVTSAAEATPGAAVSDHLTVEVEQGDGLLPTWGVWSSDDGMQPVGAIVESTLLGPFPEEIEPAPTAPDGAPVVCTVELAISGPGEYDTEPCTVSEPGNYVWVERIEPERTPADQGGSRLRAWQSTFGVASEITQVVAPAAPVAPEAPEVPAPAPAPAVAALAATGTDVPVPVVAAAAASVIGGSAALVVALKTRRRSAHRAGKRRSA
ncbi:hypothetical protein [Leifsonia poae]|uniref:Peptidase n=1 Tax=Leifsonia poae TaxID=110933 RepID=A0A9W6LY99_9MICO|nr:hypothetical protein [Leifsonia poae]GLJ74983.1 hypothetical protein GCM10017584_05560 [Leifsonia poae]